MKTISKEWLNRAEDDLNVIKEILERSDLTNMVAFHAQQALEKIYKSIIEEFEIDFVKTHKLEVLSEVVKNHFKVNDNIELTKRLDEVYISARYPSELGLLPYGKPSLEDATTFYNYVLSIYNDVASKL